MLNRILRATALLWLLFLVLSVGACAPTERVIVVTATPEPGAAVPASATASPATAEEPSEVTVPLPPAVESPATGAQPAVDLAGAPDPTLDPPPAELGRIAFMGPSGGGESLRVFLANADGTGLTPASEQLLEGYFPSLSPDGNRVAVMAISLETNEPDIYVVDVATGEATNITNQRGFDTQPIWSPDGSQIAFVTDRDGGDVDIWLMDADGGNATRLAQTSGRDELGSWSPDGTRIVYSNASEVSASLWIMDVESGESTPLTERESGRDSAPAWSPDGEHIAFFSMEDDGAPNIFTIRPDGTELQQRTGSSQPEVFPNWSPDGEWILYTSLTGGERLELVALNMTTNMVHLIPNVEGFATSWQPAGELLTDTGFTQGPQQTGVEVDPAVLEAAYRKGDPDAPVTIVEFSDYQCPFCKRWVDETLPQLEPYIEEGLVQLYFVDFPLNIHPQAPAAAQAARCGGEIAGDEGYWTMHDALFASLDRWSGQTPPEPIFNEVATEAGLDGEAIQACVESGRYSADVEAGLQEGNRLSITGTPTFFVNGHRLVGAQPFSAFEPFLPQR